MNQSELRADRWQAIAIPVSVAIILPLLGGVFTWLILDWPGRYVFAFLWIYLIIVLGITWLGWERWWFILPNKQWTSTFALIGYALSFQLVLIWLLLGWPLKYRAAFLLFELWVATLVCNGIRWLAICDMASGWFRKGYVLISVLCGLGILFIASPAAVFIDGLFTMGQIPSVKKELFPVWEPDRGNIEIVHLSDLHFTGKSDQKGIGKTDPGELLIHPYLEQIRKLKPRLILISGDLTDGGDAPQWAKVTDSLKPLAEQYPIIIAPGNHDLTTAYSGGEEEIGEIGRMLKQANYLIAQDTLNSDIYTSSGEKLRELLNKTKPNKEEVTQEQNKLIEQYIESVRIMSERGNFAREYVTLKIAKKLFSFENVYKLLMAKRLDRLWKQLFPLRWQSIDKKIWIFVLNSSEPSNHSLGISAIGAFGIQQLLRLTSIISAAGTESNIRTIGILTHHPVARPAERWTDLKTIFLFGTEQLLPDDSLALLELLSKQKAEHGNIEWYIFYGHRHQQSIGSLYGIHMIESPNLISQFEQGSELRKQRGLWVVFKAKEEAAVGWVPVMTLK